MKKIIVIDDSSTARAQVRSALAPAGYEIIEAVNGEDGLLKIEDHPDAALIVCDVNMPALGGIEMLKAVPDALRAQKKFLMLTSEAEPRLVQAAKALGAKGWIVKPFKPELFLATVNKLVG